MRFLHIRLHSIIIPPTYVGNEMTCSVYCCHTRGNLVAVFSSWERMLFMLGWAGEEGRKKQNKIFKERVRCPLNIVQKSMQPFRCPYCNCKGLNSRFFLKVIPSQHVVNLGFTFGSCGSVCLFKVFYLQQRSWPNMTHAVLLLCHKCLCGRKIWVFKRSYVAHVYLFLNHRIIIRCKPSVIVTLFGSCSRCWSTLM